MLDHVIEARRANLNHCAIQTRCSAEGSMLEGSSSDPRRLLEDAAKLLHERGARQRVDLLDRRHGWIELVLDWSMAGTHTQERETEALIKEMRCERRGATVRVIARLSKALVWQRHSWQRLPSQPLLLDVGCIVIVERRA